MARITTDLCIIGAGSGGLSLAAGAVQMGARVVLVEVEQVVPNCSRHIPRLAFADSNQDMTP